MIEVFSIMIEQRQLALVQQKVRECEEIYRGDLQVMVMVMMMVMVMVMVMVMALAIF